MLTEEEFDPANPWILNKMIQTSEWLLESHETANVLIIVCVGLSVLLALGIGFTLTRATVPVPHQVEIRNN